MARKDNLWKLFPFLKDLKIGVILIQINEAHSTKWPIGKEKCPEAQQNFSERVERANQFVIDEECPYPVYIDGWSNNYELNYRAWPDKYYYVDCKNMKILQKSEYGTDGDQDGVIIDDYVEMLSNILKSIY